MDPREGWRTVAGVVALLVVVSLLLSTPSMIYAKQISIIDTELREQTGEAQRVMAKMELGDKAQLQKVPRSMGLWNATRDYEWDRVAEILNTDVLLSRDYSHPNLLQPVHLLLIQSYNVSSFHPAPVCYRVQGWALPDDGGRSVQVSVPNATWAKEAWLSDAEANVLQGRVNAKLLGVTKGGIDGEPAEKRVALYVYLKREDWHVTNSVTWVRVEIAVPPTTSDEEVLPILADLFARTLPELFVFEAEEETLAESLVSRGGVAGWAAIGALVAAPVGFVGRGLRRGRLQAAEAAGRGAENRAAEPPSEPPGL